MQIHPYGESANDGVVQLSFFGSGTTALTVASYINQELVVRSKTEES